VEYSATGIVMDAKIIHHRKSGLKLMSIMRESLSFRIMETHSITFVIERCFQARPCDR